VQDHALCIINASIGLDLEKFSFEPTFALEEDEAPESRLRSMMKNAFPADNTESDQVHPLTDLTERGSLTCDCSATSTICC
jgi:hypothetical protein